ncbi:MAG: hypothetical protein MJ182_04500 [Treponema sp.]|nr:hypothetical protein [Treponema sp.]
MRKTVLTADIGTTSLKVALISQEGEQLAFAQCPFENPDSRYIAKDWIKALEKCVIQIGPNVKLAEAVSISGNGPTVVTEDGSTVLWNADSAPIKNEIKNTTNSLFLPKILLLRKLYPEEFERSASILSGPEFLIWQLTGNKVTILPENRYTNAYWCDELLQLNKMKPEKFPPFVKIGNCYGTIDLCCNNSVPGLKCLQGIPVYGAGPDFIAAMIGTGCTEIGAIYDCAGSSEGFNLCIPIPYKDERIRLLPNVTPGLWNAAVMIPESGRLLFNYKSKLEKETGREWTYPEVIDYCFDNPNSEGHFILETLLRNSENAISILKDVADKCGIEFPDHMFVAGGQAKNKRWMAEKELRLGIKLEVSHIPDAELLGDWKAVV